MKGAIKINMGIYFSKKATVKAEKFFKKLKVIEKQILIAIPEKAKPPQGAKDLYQILFKHPQIKETKPRIYTKKAALAKRIFTCGELIKFRYVDGVIGDCRNDLYLMKPDFNYVSSLKSKEFDWPMILVENKNNSKFKVIRKNANFAVTLTDIILKMQNDT